jgi:hypothetical protein
MNAAPPSPLPLPTQSINWVYLQIGSMALTGKKAGGVPSIAGPLTMPFVGASGYFTLEKNTLRVAAPLGAAFQVTWLPPAPLKTPTGPVALSFAGFTVNSGVSANLQFTASLLTQSSAIEADVFNNSVDGLVNVSKLALPGGTVLASNETALT